MSIIIIIVFTMTIIISYFSLERFSEKHKCFFMEIWKSVNVFFSLFKTAVEKKWKLVFVKRSLLLNFLKSEKKKEKIN